MLCLSMLSDGDGDGAARVWSWSLGLLDSYLLYLIHSSPLSPLKSLNLSL